MTKTVVRFALAIMTTLLILVVLWQFGVVIVYVLISLALASAFRPLVYRLKGKSIIRRAAWILLYVVAVGSFGIFLFLTGKNVYSEGQHLAQTVSVQDEWRLPAWLEGSIFQQSVITRLPSPSMLSEAITGSEGQYILPFILNLTKDIGGIVAAAVIILFLSVYWSTNQINFERLWLSLLPSTQRKQARTIWRIIELEIGAYIRGQLIQSFLAGLLLGVGYWLLGTPYIFTLALVGALVCLIPIVGAPLAVIPPLLIGLLTSTQLSLYMVIYTMAVVFGLVVWIKPRLFNRRWDNPILTIVLLIALVEVFGLIGIILAPPLSVIGNILWTRLVTHPLPIRATAQISDLKERLERIRSATKEMEGDSLPLVTSSMERLTKLIAKAEPLLQAVDSAEFADAEGELVKAGSIKSDLS